MILYLNRDEAAALAEIAGTVQYSIDVQRVPYGLRVQFATEDSRAYNIANAGVLVSGVGRVSSYHSPVPAIGIYPDFAEYVQAGRPNG